MKAAISYTCSCGADYLFSVERNESAEAVGEWRERVDDVAASLGAKVTLVSQDEFRCARCGAGYGDVADVAGLAVD
jgi:hypothetical protein